MKRIVSALGKLNCAKRASAVFLLCAATAIALPAQTFTTLHSFDSTDGANPLAGLVQATNGNFYGTTSTGGANGDGTIFKTTPSGALTTLYSFCSRSRCADGKGPEAAVVQASNGNFYGTTRYGAVNGEGTVFEITPSGTLMTLYSFKDAFFPSGLIQATDGNLYGITSYGGAHVHCLWHGYGAACGTAFKITRSGTLTTLYNFCSKSGCPDGANPSGLVQDTDGSFYGTTSTGGANNDGTVFRLSVHLRPFVEPQPTSGKVGATVKILGTDLTGATSVTFNGTRAVFKVVSSSLITTTVPAGATTGKVRVVTPSSTLSSNVPFRVR
jgi:uncharacterized repeat protein (TIGR03803 family)